MTARKKESPQEHLGFPVVGIGASAGGLAAFEAFFSGMPGDRDMGMAFVLVQHLAPDHKSLLVELIQRYTRMQVYEVVNGMGVKPNCVYIIPPNCYMSFVNDSLQLMAPSAPRGLRLPIDFFFLSLAKAKRERSIGIILSGTGSDGTLGARGIKSKGGRVMVQTPGSSEYDGMPLSALATGLADHELAPGEMAEQLMIYATQIPESTGGKAPASDSEVTLKKIFTLLQTQTGHDFSQYKPSTIQRRLERRMQVHQVASLDQFLGLMEQSPEEVSALFDDLLIGVTGFFRDPSAFEFIEAQVIPEIFAGKRVGEAVRIWSMGCSTGEEAYSLAILMAEYQEGQKNNVPVQIFATDIDVQAITTARAGVYPASIAGGISADRLSRYFTLEADGATYRIIKPIRDMLIFSEQDIIKDPPFSRLDLISCRNLLIYMSGELQKKLIPLFHYALRPEGVLFLGSAESIGEFSDLFAPLERKLKIYRRLKGLASARIPGRASVIPLMPGGEAGLAPSPKKGQEAERRSLREITEQTVLARVDLAAALVNRQGDILYLHGRTGEYFELAPGEAGVNNILKMAKEGLKHYLTMALHKAASGQEAVSYPGLKLQSRAGTVGVNLTVCAIDEHHSGAPLYLVILEPLDGVVESGIPEGDTPPGAVTVSLKGFRRNTKEAESLAALKKSLQMKEEYLQATNEELITANEELKSSNEELQSVNEELQSSNEELETSKEELQSVNEELSTVNAELQSKVADLSRANNDMNNLLAGTDIGTVFVDFNLRIMRFNPIITRIINLIPGDIGRPVGHIVSNLLGYTEMVSDAQAVLDTLIPKEMEVQTKAGVWYTMRIQPYRTLENVIEGAVFTFVDITDRKLLETRHQAAQVQLAEGILTMVREPLLLLNTEGQALMASPEFLSLFGITQEEVSGRSLYAMDQGRWDTPEIRLLMDTVQGNPEGAGKQEALPALEGPGGRRLQVRARRIPGGNETMDLMLLAVEDAAEPSDS